MPRSNNLTVQEYQQPRPDAMATLTLDEKISIEAATNGIERPKGYKVSYHANPAVEKPHFGLTHPMKPWRLLLTNKIVYAYGMHHAMDIYLSRAATQQELNEFHSEDYVEFLRR